MLPGRSTADIGLDALMSCAAKNTSCALREAVKAGREGQASFSRGRGTGKTTTARILAKVLNCTTLQMGTVLRM